MFIIFWGNVISSSICWGSVNWTVVIETSSIRQVAVLLGERDFVMSLAHMILFSFLDRVCVRASS